MMRTMILTVVCIIFLALPLDAQIGQLTWHLPPGDWDGVVCIGWGQIPSSGTIEVTADDGGSFLTCAWMHSPLPDGYFSFDSAKFPVETYYYRDYNSCDGGYKGYKTKNWTGSIRVQLTDGKYTFSVSGTPGAPDVCHPYEFVGANWVLVRTWGGPLFGMEQITQVGDHTPYADGTRTIAQRGCCICSMLAVARYLGTSNWTIGQFNQAMQNGDGYAVRDVRMPKAAWLLELHYLGPKAFSQATATKYLGQGYGVIIKVKVPHRDRNGNLYYSQHWVAMTPGVKLDDGVRFGMMDPAGRSSWFHKTKYKIEEMRIFATRAHYMYTQNYWWNDPFQHISPDFSRPGSSAETAMSSLAAEKSSLSSADVQGETGDASLIQTQLSLTTSTGVKIEKIEAPGLILLSNSVDASESSSLFDQVSNDNHNDEDEVYEGDMSDVPEPPPDYSEAMLSRVPAGTVKVYLYGQPNTSWRLDICVFDALGKPQDEVLTGLLDEIGKAVAEISYDPGVIVLQLGKMRGLPQEKKVFTNYLEVTDSDPAIREFFLEDGNRAGGIRVVVPDLSIPIPVPHRLVRLEGKMLQSSPEITVEAEVLEQGGLVNTSLQIKPLAFLSNWPEMANCLLARVCGKVVKSAGSVALIDSGKDKMSMSGIDVSLQVGDIVAFDTVIRASRRLKAIAGTITKY